MQYKTMALGLLEARPELHERLRTNRTLLKAVNAYAMYLKAKHQAWIEEFRTTRPLCEESQLSSEALEVALAELQDRLSRHESEDETDSQRLDEAMAFVRKRTPPA